MTDLQALRLSIRHRGLDIWSELKKVRRIVFFSRSFGKNGSLVWEDTKEMVLCYAEHCPLCRKYWHNCQEIIKEENNKCVAIIHTRCPLYKYHEGRCDYGFDPGRRVYR